MGSPLLPTGQKEAPLQTWGDGHCSWALLWAGATDGTDVGNEKSPFPPYKPLPEILPMEVFCLCKCAGKQGGGQCSVRHHGGSTDGSSTLGCGGEAPPPSPPRAAPEQSNSVPYRTPFQAFAILCPAPRRAFPCYPKEPGSPAESSELRSRSAWPVTHGKSRATEPQRNRKDQLPREPPVLPLRDTQLRAGEKLLDGAKALL